MLALNVVICARLQSVSYLCYNNPMQLLLISSSFVSGKGYLEHCETVIKQILDKLPDGEVLFIPYATTEQCWDKYSKSAAKFFGSIGQPYKSIHQCHDAVSYIKNSKIKMIFIGGGNSFLLIKTLQDKGLIDTIRDTVQKGTGYMGTSAGSNIACPTLQTTNDMPIVEPSSFKSLNFVNFQINPHFVAGSLIDGHKGETREQRIAEYHELNNTPVIGLPELSWIRVDDELATLGGVEAVIFEKDKPSRQWSVNSTLSV
jgi:dipeptidase E